MVSTIGSFQLTNYISSIGTTFAGSSSARKNFSVLDLSMFTSVTAFNTGHLSYINATTIILPSNAKSIENYGMAHSGVTYLVITYTAGTFAFNGSWSNSSSISYIYVPDTKVSAYSGRTVYPIIGQESIIERDREFSISIPAARYGWNNDLHWTVEENDYISIVSQGNGVATFRATGILPDTDTTVTLSYQSNRGNGLFKGTKILTVKPTPVIEFEDAEVKRVCVNSWGGPLCISTKVPGIPGEITYQQAAAVTSMGTQFKSNKTITVFHELKYFSTLDTLSAEAFRDTTSLRYITLPNSLRTIGNYAFMSSGLYELEFNEGLTTLGNTQIIWECKSLTKVTYPSTITNIAGINASTHSNNLTAVISYAKTPPTLGSSSYIVSYTYFYVPNESLKAYRLKAAWSSYDGRVLGFFSGPSNLFMDGTYTYSLRSIFDGYTDLQFSLEPNDYVTMSVIDGSAVLECSGITQNTESEAHLSYSFVYKGRTVSGTIDIPIAYKEVIDFEDAGIKEICVNNWGGEYNATSNLYGVSGEVTVEQILGSPAKKAANVISRLRFVSLTSTFPTTTPIYGLKYIQPSSNSGDYTVNFDTDSGHTLRIYCYYSRCWYPDGASAYGDISARWTSLGNRNYVTFFSDQYSNSYVDTYVTFKSIAGYRPGSYDGRVSALVDSNDL